MFTLSNDELRKKPNLIGDTCECPFCHEDHKIVYGTDKYGRETKLLAAVKCPDNGKLYLVGFEGRKI